MDVLVEDPANVCRYAEILLISKMKNLSGCQNERPGGEGVAPSRTHSCYLYLVIAGAGEGISLGAAVMRRRRAACVPRHTVSMCAGLCPGFEGSMSPSLQQGPMP